MKYVVTGSIGHISQSLVKTLTASGHDVTVISSNPSKTQAIEALHAKALIGSVEDVAFLKQAFKGVDAVYTMVPPNFGAADWKQYIAGIGKNYAEAIRANAIKHVVNLSSMGAHMPEGCGPVSGLYHAEQALNALADTHVKHLRPGFFYYNFMGNINMIKHMGIIGGNYGEDSRMVMADTNDIADAAAEELLNLKFTGKSVRYISSDVKTTHEIAAILGTAIGKPDLKWMNFSDADTTQALQQAGLPAEVAINYAEMGAALRHGDMSSDYFATTAAPTGKRPLDTFAPAFAAAYAQS